MLEAIRQPEYTGENRCWPCTVVNAAIVALVAVVVAVVSPLVALALAAGGVGAIVLRGYVVPYTPRFAPRLVERLPAAWNPFHESVGPDESDSLADDVDPEALLGALVEAGVIVPDGERLLLDEGFRERWRGEMRTLRELPIEELAEAARDASEVADGAETVEGRKRTYVVLSDGTDDPMAKSWLTRPVAVAETAAVRALSDALPSAEATSAAGPLRMFLEECPVCEAPARETSEAMCCGGGRTANEPPRDVLACEECGERLYTFPD